MQEEYTIFDNFDKLDLNPAADKIAQGDAVASDFILSPYLPPTIDNIRYGSYNETNLHDILGLKYVNSPYGFTESMNHYVPDMFRFITNKRFYIKKNGDIAHTQAWFKPSQVKKPLEIVKENISLKVSD